MVAMPAQTATPLYDTARAARLMDEAGMDLLLASTRANVAYLTDSFSVLYWEYPDVAHCLEVEDDGCGAPFYFAGLPRDLSASSSTSWSATTQGSSETSVSGASAAARTAPTSWPPRSGSGS